MLFGHSKAVEQALKARHRTYTAAERAKLFNVTYELRQRLGLRRTGSIDVDKEGRERARRDRYNAKRRALRAAARAAREILHKSITTRGVNRCVPSL
jgi:hypothetical protein